jgi:SAM-dependent methyltransferase
MIERIKERRPKSLETALDRCRGFWDLKAAENPFWYVSSFGPYIHRDLHDFWESGGTIWHDLKETSQYSPHQSDVVVEIGCGVGRLTRTVASEVGWIHAFDISERMLQLARQHGLANVTFHHTDGDTLLPLGDASADLVLAYCVLHHLPSIQAFERYVCEMFRVVRPGGLIAFTLTPRNWRVHLAPLFRLRRWMKEVLSSGGPCDLYRREWIGIRPRKRTVMRLLPKRGRKAALHGENWLFVARRNCLKYEASDEEIGQKAKLV